MWWPMFCSGTSDMRLTSCLLFLAASLLRADDAPQRVRLTVEREEGAGWKEVNPPVFAQRDKVRFRLSSNFAGYLYVMNHGTSGGYELLFPRSDTGQDNSIEARKIHRARPSRDGSK